MKNVIKATRKIEEMKKFKFSIEKRKEDNTRLQTRSSPAKKGEKSSKPSSPKQQSAPVPESDAYFTIKTNRGKVKENSPITNVRISPIKFKESMLKKERLKRSYQIFYLTLRFLPAVLI